ncbi:MAG: TrpR family protein YerC/YecD [Parcubacteria group bacterium GW2011_GWA1_53_13]|nr:MAG: TrpR family protein YerC/YecD [Parcubacteria group bacterium GW2011_GWA1_53_13]
MRVKVRQLKDSERIETLDALYTAASALRGRESVKLFLRDLLTPSERIMLGRRIIIARRLLAGEGPTSIAAEMKVGYDTIYRVERWLHDQMPGYEQAIKGMEKEFEKRQKTRDEKKLYATSALYRLKKKYPLHFLLFPTPKLKK